MLSSAYSWFPQWRRNDNVLAPHVLLEKVKADQTRRNETPSS